MPDFVLTILHQSFVLVSQQPHIVHIPVLQIGIRSSKSLRIETADGDTHVPMHSQYLKKISPERGRFWPTIKHRPSRGHQAHFIRPVLR